MDRARELDLLFVKEPSGKTVTVFRWGLTSSRVSTSTGRALSSRACDEFAGRRRS